MKHIVRKFVAGILFTTLGTMWLPFALPPCVLAATLDDQPHNCCPHAQGKIVSNGHMHDQDECTSCDVVKPVLKYAKNFVQPSKTPGIDYQPVIVEWSQFQVIKLDFGSFNSHISTYLPVHPTLKNCVLLI